MKSSVEDDSSVAESLECVAKNSAGSAQSTGTVKIEDEDTSNYVACTFLLFALFFICIHFI